MTQSITTSAAEQANDSDKSTTFSTEAIVGTAGGAAAVAVVAVFVVYKKRQSLASPGLYVGAAATPVRG